MATLTAASSADRMVCHCLQVRESQVRDCVQLLGLDCVPEIKAHCGAGGGCTACHRRIRDIIRDELSSGAVSDACAAAG